MNKIYLISNNTSLKDNTTICLFAAAAVGFFLFLIFDRWKFQNCFLVVELNETNQNKMKWNEKILIDSMIESWNLCVETLILDSCA